MGSESSNKDLTVADPVEIWGFRMGAYLGSLCETLACFLFVFFLGGGDVYLHSCCLLLVFLLNSDPDIMFC